MAGKRGDKRKQKTTASEGKRSSPRKSPRKFKADDISDLSDDEHLQNEAVVDRNKKQKKSTKRILSGKNAPSIQNDHVEFSLSNLTSHLTCELCGGYYRDCHTIVDCLHSFCRSCLILFFEKKGLVGKNKNVTPRLSCPTCDIEVGPHPFRRHTSISTVQIIPDRTLQEVIDKMFPRFKVQEVEDEKKFYAERNIKLKADTSDRNARNAQESMKSPLAGGVTMAASSTAMATAAAAFMSDNIIELRLQPDIKSSKSTKRLPALHNHQLRTSGKLKIISLKKYILQRLDSGVNKRTQRLIATTKLGCSR
ncbi:polycomb group RING finger protein [Skeletonema marinoi]|uniref:Polycomb group RING finger protein n=1 Tax=Skeletonema marinoi TaxID=267567 RepID=A0AAD9D5J9_9STRA|nr:polycomb group RING finger protein [Skeletonema marinoi]